MTIRKANATVQKPDPRGRPYASDASEAATSGTGPPSLTRTAICRCKDLHPSGERSSPNPGPGSRADEPLDWDVPGTLPMSLTSFVGRDWELDQLRSLLREGKRLVTLVGIGGGGKTPPGPAPGFRGRGLGG